VGGIAGVICGVWKYKSRWLRKRRCRENRENFPKNGASLETAVENVAEKT
jgi:hypothetical protein